MALLKGVATGGVVSLSIVVVASQMLNLQTLSTTPPEAATALDDSGTLPGAGPDTDESTAVRVPRPEDDSGPGTAERDIDPTSPTPPGSVDTDLAAADPGAAPAVPDAQGDQAADLQMGAPDPDAQAAPVDRSPTPDAPPADAPDSRLANAPEADPTPDAVPAAPGPTVIVDPNVTLAAPSLQEGPTVSAAPSTDSGIDAGAPAAPGADETMRLAEAPTALGPPPAPPADEEPEQVADPADSPVASRTQTPGDPVADATSEDEGTAPVDRAGTTQADAPEEAPLDEGTGNPVDIASDADDTSADMADAAPADGALDGDPAEMPGTAVDLAGDTPPNGTGETSAPDGTAPPATAPENAPVELAQETTGDPAPGQTEPDRATASDDQPAESASEPARGVSAADVIDLDQIVVPEEDGPAPDGPMAGTGIDGTDELEAGVPQFDRDDDIATPGGSAVTGGGAAPAAPSTTEPGRVRTNRLVQIEPAPEPDPAPEGQQEDAEAAGDDETATADNDTDAAPAGRAPRETAEAEPATEDDPSLSPDERVALAEAENPEAGPTLPSSNLIERRMQGIGPDIGTPGPGAGPAPSAAPSVTATPLEIDPDAPVAELTGDPMVDFRQPFENPGDLPVMAVILLDYGGPMIDVPVNATIALDATLPDAAERAAAYFAMGFEVAVMPDMTGGGSAEDTAQALRASLSAVPFSLAVVEDPSRPLGTASDTVETILDGLSDSGHGLVTLPQGQNRAQQLAARAEVPAGLVFRQIDNQGQDLAAVKRFLDNAAFRARQQETVILLGRNRPETTGAILEWRLGNRASSVELAPLSAVLVPTGD